LPVSEVFEEIEAHYRKSLPEAKISAELGTLYIPVGPVEAAALEKRGVILRDKDLQVHAAVAYLQLTLQVSAFDADNIVAEDYGNPTYAEFVKRYHLDREPA
jgi:lambda repressor-like predicted transcriptional regulator